MEVSLEMLQRTRRRTLYAVGLVILAMLLAACGGGGSSSSTSSTSSTSSSSSTASAATVEVSLKDFKFTPSEIRVKVGQKVRFVNNDSVRHNVVQATAENATTGPFGFQGPVQMPGDAWEYTFNTPGTYPIVCNLDGHNLLGMTATVIVEQ